MREVNTHKIIRIFLASSIDDTKEERDKLQNKILAVWNPIFNKFNIELKIFRCEQMTEEWLKRNQKTIDDEIRNSDVFIVIFKNTVGNYTFHEFEVARDCYSKTNGKPRIYPYISNELIHEYEHVASYHNEIVEKHHNSTLHTVQVGLRTKEYIVDRDGERLLYRNEGENLNEGLTQYLTEDKLSAEELSMAQAMRIYPFATEAAASLSDILGSASIREDFYEGTSHIRDALDETLGQGTFQRFCSCLDQASESPESDQRREAMREANKILNTLAARKAAEKQNKEA